MIVVVGAREITRTGLALAQEEYTNDFIFLISLPFEADSLVDSLRDTKSLFLASKADCPGLWRFIRGRTKSNSKGVIVIATGTHEMS
jgi:hypothetical protein